MEVIAADLVLLLHFAFVLFVILGGLLVWRWSWVAYAHIPAAIWGVLIEFSGWMCPLTPLEQQLRSAAGEASYSVSFVEHYILPLLYPVGLTRTTQILLGTAVLLINVGIYGFLLYRRGLHKAKP